MIKKPLKRPNQTIGMTVTGTNKLTIVSRKLYSSILLHSQAQGDQSTYSAPLIDLLGTANLEHSNHTEIRKHFRALRNFSVDYSTRTQDVEKWETMGLIENPSITKGRGTPAIATWKLADRIRDQLIDPVSFWTPISLQISTKLTSGSSISLYEICCQYRTNDYNGMGGLTPKLSPKEWTAKILGDPEKKYEYRFFRRDVLKPAIQEINELTDLNVELFEIKNGRSIETIYFKITRKELPAIEQICIDPTLSLRIQSVVKLTKTKADAVIKKYNKELINRQLDILEERLKTTIVASPAAWFGKGLKEEWVKPVAAVPKPVLPEYKAPEEKDISPKDAENKARKELILADFNSLNEDDKSTLIETFLSKASNFTRLQYKKSGLESKLVEMDLLKFLDSN
jgi:hypothetical protein